MQLQRNAIATAFSNKSIHIGLDLEFEMLLSACKVSIPSSAY